VQERLELRLFGNLGFVEQLGAAYHVHGIELVACSFHYNEYIVIAPVADATCAIVGAADVHLVSCLARARLALFNDDELAYDYAYFAEHVYFEHALPFRPAEQLVLVGRANQQRAGSRSSAVELLDDRQLFNYLVVVELHVEVICVGLVVYERLVRVGVVAGSEHLELVAGTVDDRSAIVLVRPTSLSRLPHSNAPDAPVVQVLNVKLAEQLVVDDAPDVQLPRPAVRLHARPDLAAAAKQHERDGQH